MTKKDYILLATALKPYYHLLPEYQNHQAIAREIIESVANALKRDNYRFDFDKFYQFLEKKRVKNYLLDGFIKSL